MDGYRITSPEWTWVDLASQRLTVDELVAAGWDEPAVNPRIRFADG